MKPRNFSSHFRTANSAVAESPAELVFDCIATANALPEQLADGWHVLAPFGEFPEPGGRYVQVFGADQASAMIRSWNSIAGRSFRWLKNVRHRLKPSLSMPIFDAPPGAAHPDLDPSDWSKLPIVGEVSELRASNTALEGFVEWSDAARRGDREKGPLHPSINWWHERADSAGRVYPEHVESVTLTRTPNIRTVPAWTANTEAFATANKGDEAGHWVTMEGRHVFIKEGDHRSGKEIAEDHSMKRRPVPSKWDSPAAQVKQAFTDASWKQHQARISATPQARAEFDKAHSDAQALYEKHSTALPESERAAFHGEVEGHRWNLHQDHERVRIGEAQAKAFDQGYRTDKARTGNTTLPGTSPEENQTNNTAMTPQELTMLRKSLGLPETADPAACIQAATTANTALATLAERESALQTANTTVTTLNTERDTLRTQHGAITAERDGLRTANASLVAGILDVAQQRGVITPAEREAFQARISTANTAVAALGELATRKPALNTQAVEINGTRLDLSTANARQGALQDAVAKRMKSDGCDYDTAYSRVKADPNFAALFAAMQDPAKAKA